MNLASTAFRWLGGDYLRLAVGLIFLIAIGMTAWRVSAWRGAYVEREAWQAEAKDLRARVEAEEGCREGSKCAGRLEQSRRDGLDAVKKAKAAAAEAARAREAEIEASGRAAVERAARAARDAAVKARAWEARYREAVSTDAICRAWSEREVPCPVE